MKKNISSGYYSNSEAFASELLEYPEERNVSSVLHGTLSGLNLQLATIVCYPPLKNVKIFL